MTGEASVPDLPAGIELSKLAGLGLADLEDKLASYEAASPIVTRYITRDTGVYKVPYSLMLFPTPIFLNLYFLPQIFNPFCNTQKVHV